MAKLTMPRRVYTIVINDLSLHIGRIVSRLGWLGFRSKKSRDMVSAFVMGHSEVSRLAQERGVAFDPPRWSTVDRWIKDAQALIVSSDEEGVGLLRSEMAATQREVRRLALECYQSPEATIQNKQHALEVASRSTQRLADLFGLNRTEPSQGVEASTMWAARMAALAHEMDALTSPDPSTSGPTDPTQNLDQA